MDKKTITAIIITIIVIVGGYGVYRYLNPVIPVSEGEQKEEENGQTNLENLEQETAGEIAELANPASVYCLDIGGELILHPEGVDAYCVLPDGRVCAQWKLFNSEGEECVSPEE